MILSESQFYRGGEMLNIYEFMNSSETFPNVPIYFDIPNDDYDLE